MQVFFASVQLYSHLYYTTHRRRFDENAAKRHICLRAADAVHREVARMARRGSNSFKRNDAIRAIRSAKDAGMESSMIEIVAKDGTTFRVYGDKAACTETTQESATKAWDKAITKSASDQKKGRGGGKDAAD